MPTATNHSAPRAAASPGRYRGQVVYLFAFDVGYEIGRRPLTELLGQRMAQFSFDASRRSPRQLFFHRPDLLRLPALERLGPGGPVRVERQVKVFGVGAISLSLRVPFEVDRLEDLVAYHDLELSHRSIQSEAQALAEEVFQALRPHLIQPVEKLADEEAYTVFCLEAPAGGGGPASPSAEQWLQQNRRSVAALLTQEADPAQLSEQEAEESTSRFLSYYAQDIVVMDWDAALIVDEHPDFEEPLYVLEMVNLQLAELEAYDRLIDAALERSYRDLGQSTARRKAGVMRELRELRIDMARLSDELLNITKFFGDWHLARIYECVGSRFHLADWHRTIEAKLRTLDDLYQLLKHEQDNRWMLILEITIVVLFVIDLAILAVFR